STTACWVGPGAAISGFFEKCWWRKPIALSWNYCRLDRSESSMSERILVVLQYGCIGSTVLMRRFALSPTRSRSVYANSMLVRMDVITFGYQDKRWEGARVRARCGLILSLMREAAFTEERPARLLSSKESR